MLNLKDYEHLELLLLQTQKELFQKWNERSPFNLTLPEAGVLQCLGRADVHNLAEIEGLLGVMGLETSDSLYDKLAGEGLIERLQDERDPEVILLKISEKGSEVLQSIRKLKSEMMEYLLQDLTSEELSAMEKFITLFLSKMAGD